MSEQFTYNASVLALGGVINRNGRRTVVPSVASVALAPTGGEGHVCESNYRNEAGISFDHAESHVVGIEDGRGGFTTYTDVMITGLNILNRLRIGLLRATVESRHDLGGSSPESRFRLQALYRDVEIDGYEVVPELDVDLTEHCDTYDKIEKRLRSMPDVYEQRFGVAPGRLVTALSQVPPPPLRASLVKQLHVRPVRQEVASALGRPHGYGLTVRGFGRAHFAEYHVKPGRRRVTLLRLDLDSRQQLEEPYYDCGDTQPELMQRSQTLAFSNTSAPMAFSNTRESGDEYDGSFTVTSLDGNGSPPWDK